MPREITEMPSAKPRGNQKYPWDEWFTEVGQKMAFDKGEDGDFDCLATSFAVQAREAAKERGFSLHIPAVEKDSDTVSVEVRALDDEDGDEPTAESTDEPTAEVESDES